MAKRKLTQQQSRRIAKQQKALRQTTELENVLPGLVISRYGKQADVETDSGELYRCHLRRNLGDLVTGDRVALQLEDEGAVIVSVEPAKNRLQRPDSYGKLKAIGANIDQMVIVIAPQPEAHPNLIDRYLVVAENLDVQPLLLVNKSDLIAPSSHETLTEIAQLYSSLHYPILHVSAKADMGMAALEAQLANRTSIFVGQSGVGKSSLLQNLLPGEDLKIGDLSEQVGKGKHTTTYARLYHFSSGGNCIDSPGIREFGLWHFDKTQLLNGFVELRQYGGSCKFSDCSHNNDPGCAIREAVDAGEIQPQRYESFLRIAATLDDVQVKHPN